MVKNICFDLDGTLTDPSLGITNSVVYALNKWGIKVEDRQSLTCFIGPPLIESFEKYYGFSRKDAVQSVDWFREYFKDRGIFENVLYRGCPKTQKRFLKSPQCRVKSVYFWIESPTF